MGFSAAISYEVAKTIFSDVQFDRVEMDGKVVGYAATYAGREFKSASITRLCGAIWDVANGGDRG